MFWLKIRRRLNLHVDCIRHIALLGFRKTEKYPTEYRPTQHLNDIEKKEIYYLEKLKIFIQ